MLPIPRSHPSASNNFNHYSVSWQTCLYTCGNRAACSGFLTPELHRNKSFSFFRLTMYESRYETNTEETFILSSLKEFVKLWGSGCHPNLQLQCSNGQVSFNFSAQLGGPADRHFVPNEPHPHHGFHAPLPPRRKSPQQREHERARAAAQRASKTVKETADCQ
jgi:hypothetical protein